MSIVRVEERLSPEVYAQCLDDLQTAKIEIEVVLRETLIRLRHAWGAIIRESYPVGSQRITQVVIKLAHDLGCTDRTLWYCIRFFDKFGDVDVFLAGQDKAINWRKIINQHLPDVKQLEDKPEDAPPKACASPELPMFSGPLLDLYQKYQAEYVTCIFHLDRQRQVGIGHHFPSTKGAGGKTTIPLCDECHSSYHHDTHLFWTMTIWTNRVVLINFMTTRFWEWLEQWFRIDKEGKSG